MTPSIVATRLSRIVLLVRNGTMQASVNFYHQALGLPIIRVTDEWAELSTTTSNYHENPNGIVLSLQAGAHLDGPIQYPAHGKIALLRAPVNDNHMIGLYEPNITGSSKQM